jgi:sec-independent protein translocase protein TatB
MLQPHLLRNVPTRGIRHATSSFSFYASSQLLPANRYLPTAIRQPLSANRFLRLGMMKSRFPPMSLTDTIIILVGALVLFGPKKLPELARQLGKIMGELRRASNEFKFQMEEELRVSEQAERTKVAAAAPASSAAPSGPVLVPPVTGEPVANRISPRAVTNEPAADLPQEAAPHG